MSTFFLPANHTAKPSGQGFSMSDFSADQKAHAYAEAESRMSPPVQRMDPPWDESQWADTQSAGDTDAAGARSHRRAWAAGIAFFTTVFASMAAAATVVSSDLPLMVVGL